MASRLPTLLPRVGHRQMATAAGPASMSTGASANASIATCSTTTLASPPAASSNQPQKELENQTFELPDGRLLGFAEYGDPAGVPLLYFHGYPSSRLEAGPLHHVARRQNLRILSLDRPGYGLSTPQTKRTFLDWPADVRAFTGAMGLSSFAVMGLSGGGPYAIACAHSLPKSMLRSVGVFAGAPPWVAGAHHNTWIRRLASWMATRCPSILHAIFASILGATRWLMSRSFVVTRLDKFIETQDAKPEIREMVPVDTTKTVAERRERMLNYVLGEPFRQGVDAVVYEAKILTDRDWGFRLEDVEYAPVRIWHGTEDKNAPIQMIRYLADKLPGGQLTELTGLTHYTMWKQIEAAFVELRDEGK